MLITTNSTRPILGMPEPLLGSATPVLPYAGPMGLAALIAPTAATQGTALSSAAFATAGTDVNRSKGLPPRGAPV